MFTSAQPSGMRGYCSVSGTTGYDVWDVIPAQNEPSVAVLEDVRLALKRPKHLRKARELWWGSRKTLCLEHLYWDSGLREVVSPKGRRSGALAIVSAHFDPQGYTTVLQLAGSPTPLEIAL